MRIDVQKPKQLYTKEEAKANAERWMRYTHDFVMRFIREPMTKMMERVLGCSLFNEGLETFILSLVWIATTAILITFHLNIYR